MNRIATIGIVTGVAALLVGCGGSGNGLVNVPNPRVRFANVLPGIASAKAKVGSDEISANIPFGTVSTYAITPNGNKDLTVGDATFNNLATLANQLYETNKRYTGVGYGTAPRTILLLEENESQSGTNTISMRAVHAGQGGANVDVYLSAVGDPLPANPAFDGVAVGSTTSFSAAPVIGTNQYRVRVYADGNTSTVLVDQTLVIQPRDRVSVIVYTDAGQASGWNALLLKENI
ncbi:MAG: DUF4397 domain-containing protein [Chlorobia bacterium]|nr:DUF4397 domain-containing protein [Fimbriimonadaceae bacterium]